MAIVTVSFYEQRLVSLELTCRKNAWGMYALRHGLNPPIPDETHFLQHCACRFVISFRHFGGAHCPLFWDQKLHEHTLDPCAKALRTN